MIAIFSDDLTKLQDGNYQGAQDGDYHEAQDGDYQAQRPLTENIVKSKSQTGITFEEVLIMNQKFNFVLKFTYCLYLQII